MNRLLLLRRVYSTFLLSMFCVLAFAQGKQITGVIKDGTGEPMICLLYTSPSPRDA